MNLSESQNRMVASATSLAAFAVVISLVAVMLWGACQVLLYLSGAIVPVLLGFFLALFFKPYYRFLRRAVGSQALALVLMLVSVFVPLGFLLWYAGAVIVDQASNLIAQGPTLLKQVFMWFRGTFPRLYELLVQIGLPADGMDGIFAKYGATALKAGSGAIKILLGVLSAIVTFIFFIFFLTTRDRRGSDIVAPLLFLKEPTREFLAVQIDTFIEILVSFFQRQIVICLIEGVMYGVGFWAVGLPYGFLVGFTLGVLNLIPLFGSFVCMPLALPLAYFADGGSLTRLFLVLAVWLTGQFMDGYFITPRIQGNKTGLGYAGVIFSFFFWSIVLGPVLGMLLAIPLSAFCVVLWRAVMTRYISPMV